MRIYFTMHSKKRNTLAPIYITMRGGRLYRVSVPTQLNIDPINWDAKKEWLKFRVDADYDYDTIKNKLEGLRKHIEKEYITEVANESKVKRAATGYTTEEKKDLKAKWEAWLIKQVDKYNNPAKYKPKEVTLFSFIENFIHQSKTRVNPKTNNVISYKQQRDYIRTFEDLKAFCKHKRKQYNFKDIDLDFYNDFIEFLQKKNLAQNTIGKKFRVLKVFLNAATEEGYNTNLRYTSKRFISVSEKTENVYLDERELRQIYDLDLSENPRLDKVRDVFLVACWTGLRYGDLRNIPGNVNGDFIEIEQSKTGNEVIIPLHHTVKAILEKYDNNLPKPISNQKFNDYVKDVVKLAGINEGFHKGITKGGQKISKKYEKWELVSSHTGRRSFATNLYKQGFPSYSIMQITGHKTETAFLKYIKVTPKEHAEKLKAFWLKQKSHLKIA